MSSAGIVVENLTKTYRSGRVRALDGVSLEIRPGEVFGVIGPNGAGKTTLMGCLLGFLFPDRGTVTVDGLPPDDLAVRYGTGHLPERLVFDRWMTGRRFLAYHHALARLSAASRGQDVYELFGRVGLAWDDGGKHLARYSRGMLQRLGLAQALLARPRYLFLDEPTSGMDPAGAVMTRRIVGELKAAGATIVINSHQMEQVEKICDRVAFVKEGHVLSVETVRAGAEAVRVLRIRTVADWLATEDHLASLREAAVQAGASVVGEDANGIRCSVEGDEGASHLLAALVAAGVPVVEAAPEEGRLERLFLEGGRP